MAEKQAPEVYQRLLKARGEEIRRGREANGWSQAELAAHASTSQQTVDRLERGVVEHSKAYPKIRRVLGMDMHGYDSWPLTEDGSEEPGEAQPFRSKKREFEALELIQAGRIPVFANVGNEARLVDAVPKVFPYEFAQGANAILITDTVMEPVLRVGDIVVVHPHIPAQIGNEVAYSNQGMVFVRTLMGEDDESWIVQSWNPVETRNLSKSNISSLDVAVTRIMKSR